MSSGSSPAHHLNSHPRTGYVRPCGGILCDGFEHRAPTTLAEHRTELRILLGTHVKDLRDSASVRRHLCRILCGDAPNRKAPPPPERSLCVSGVEPCLKLADAKRKNPPSTLGSSPTASEALLDRVAEMHAHAIRLLARLERPLDLACIGSPARRDDVLLSGSHVNMNMTPTRRVT